jgi:uncharacterized protein YkwD
MGLSGRRFRSGLLGTAVTAIVVLVATAVPGDRLNESGSSTRGVLSSLSPKERMLTLSTASLYAKNDPWKAYLASDSVCPGGERTDLPVARQVETVACLLNFARKRRGLHELVVVPVLNGASVKKAKAIVRCENFAHNPCGGDWTSEVRSTGYGGEVGENLYIAGGPWGAPRVAVDAWLNSAQHRENLFGREWREQGLAVLSAASFGGYRDMSLWVSVLGER